MNGRLGTLAVWGGLAALMVLPVLAAAQSPLLAWRQPVYIIGGFAGIIALALLLVQPLLAGASLPRLSAAMGRRMHRVLGLGIVVGVVVHVAFLWITSPPDVIDVLLLRSPTPFALWGVAAMWAVFAAAGLAALRRPLKLGPRRWRAIHLSLAAVTVSGTIGHALLIEGAMETVTKVVLCFAVAAVTIGVVYSRWPRRRQ